MTPSTKKARGHAVVRSPGPHQVASPHLTASKCGGRAIRARQQEANVQHVQQRCEAFEIGCGYQSQPVPISRNAPGVDQFSIRGHFQRVGSAESLEFVEGLAAWKQDIDRRRPHVPALWQPGAPNPPPASSRRAQAAGGAAGESYPTDSTAGVHVQPAREQQGRDDRAGRRRLRAGADELPSKHPGSAIASGEIKSTAHGSKLPGGAIALTLSNQPPTRDARKKSDEPHQALRLPPAGRRHQPHSEPRARERLQSRQASWRCPTFARRGILTSQDSGIVPKATAIKSSRTNRAGQYRSALDKLTGCRDRRNHQHQGEQMKRRWWDSRHQRAHEQPNGVTAAGEKDVWIVVARGRRS